MRKIKKVIFMFLVVYTIFSNSVAGYAAEEGEQKYFLLYMYDQDDGAAVEIGTYQIIMDQESDGINLDNLTLFPMEAGVYHPFQMEQPEEEKLTREVREYLLYTGYAYIEDEAVAEDYELKAQEHAKLDCLGGWEEMADGREDAGKQKGTAGGREKNLSEGNEADAHEEETQAEKKLPKKVIFIAVIFIIFIRAIRKRHKKEL